MRYKTSTIAAVQLGICLGSVRMPTFADAYTSLRSQMVGWLNEAELTDVSLPVAPPTSDEWWKLYEEITKQLRTFRAERVGSGSDVFAWPLFIIAMETPLVLISGAVGEVAKESYEMVSACLDDLSVNPKLSHLLDIEIGLLRAACEKEEEKSVSYSAVTFAALRFVWRVVEEAGQVTPMVDDATLGRDESATEDYHKRLQAVISSMIERKALEQARAYLTSTLFMPDDEAADLTTDNPLRFAESWLLWISQKAPENDRERALQKAFVALEGQGQMRSVPALRSDLSTVTHTIVLVHGIRTSGEWDSLLRRIFAPLPNVRIAPIKYGYLDTLRFLFPWFRERTVNEIRRRINDRVAEAQSTPGAMVSAVAHSFGSHALARAIADNLQLRFHHIVLCGAILSHDFRWELYMGRISGIVVNDRGARDIWPALAQSLSWGYGATGVMGAAQSRVEDRLHDCGHSGFFTSEFVEAFWVPLFRDDKVVQPEHHGAVPPWWYGAISQLPLRWIWLVLAAAAGLAMVRLTSAVAQTAL